MWQFLCGFGCGIYIGSYYNCKPIIEKVNEAIRKNFQKEK